jgi:cytosine/adenosine deaminase-related metal-dependent hydrolase
MLNYRAAWVLPITAPPIRDGWVTVDRGRIVAVGSAKVPHAGGTRRPTIDLGSVAVLPGLVNAHTHFELSWMRGRIEPCDRFPDWIRALMSLRREMPDPRDARVVAATANAIDEAVRCGTAAAADISNTLVSFAPLATSGLGGVLFKELIGFNPDDAASLVSRGKRDLEACVPSETLKTGLAAHAPYSVAPDVFQAIRADLDEHPDGRSSVHLGESRDELEFLRSGTGAWRQLLEDVGAWNSAWTVPDTSPVAYLDRLRFLDHRVLVVHGVQLTAPELDRLASLRVTLVACARSNVRTAAGTPPVQAFYDAGVRVAVGTDSLGGVDDLNLFSELAALRAIAPGVAASRLLHSATRTGAEALGHGAQFGAIAPGLRARLLAVDVPAAEVDVEEYLVHGIAPEQMRWVDEGVFGGWPPQEAG